MKPVTPPTDFISGDGVVIDGAGDSIDGWTDMPVKRGMDGDDPIIMEFDI